MGSSATFPALVCALAGGAHDGRGVRRGPRRGASPEPLPPGEGRRGTRARLRAGGEGRGITRPAREPQARGRPGTPLAPVKRAALRGGTGGSQTRPRAFRAAHQAGGVRLARIPPDGASPASAGISEPSFFSPKRCVRSPGGQLPTAAHSPALLDGASARRCRAECGPWITARALAAGIAPRSGPDRHGPAWVKAAQRPEREPGPKGTP